MYSTVLYCTGLPISLYADTQIYRTGTVLYRLLYIVQPGVFTHDCSVLLTVPPPPASIYIHSTEAVLYEKLRQLLCYSTILYCTILYDLLLP